MTDPAGEPAGARQRALRVLVVTVVHHPQDARVLHRQIAALRAAGVEVTYAAPFTGYGVPRVAGITTVDLPRSSGRRRIGALRAARVLLRGAAGRADLVLLHDPELLAALVGRGPGGPPVVWDVHEDTAAAVELRGWIPAAVRVPVAAAVRLVERVAERRVHLLLAEYGYAARFARPHPVVPNTTVVPAAVRPPGADRVVHVGALTAARGAPALLAAGAELRRRSAGAVAVHLVGPADAATAPAVAAADRAGDVVWHGFVPNDEAMRLVDGAAAGLVLLRDNAHHRSKIPTKTMEYLAHGVPVLTHPLPAVARLLAASGGGVTVPDGEPAAVGTAVADAVLDLLADPDRHAAVGAAGHAHARAHLDWARDADAFVAVLRRWAGPTGQGSR